MSERAKVEERARRKEAEIQGYEEKIRAARVYLQALRDVLKLMGEEDTDTSSGDDIETELRPGSAVAQAREIITLKGAPIHINDLLDALGKPQTRENRASLIGSLSAYVRRREIFTRPAPNTFGLLELGHAFPGETQEPPQDFGRVSAAKASEEDDEIPR
jgi:hypothetical protein